VQAQAEAWSDLRPCWQPLLLGLTVVEPEAAQGWRDQVPRGPAAAVARVHLTAAAETSEAASAVEQSRGRCRANSDPQSVWYAPLPESDGLGQGRASDEESDVEELEEKGEHEINTGNRGPADLLMSQQPFPAFKATTGGTSFGSLGSMGLSSHGRVSIPDTIQWEEELDDNFQAQNGWPEGNTFGQGEAWNSQVQAGMPCYVQNSSMWSWQSSTATPWCPHPGVQAPQDEIQWAEMQAELLKSQYEFFKQYADEIKRGMAPSVEESADSWGAYLQYGSGPGAQWAWPNHGGAVPDAGRGQGKAQAKAPRSGVGATANVGGGIPASKELPEDQKTTVMLRNLPNDYTRDDLLVLLDAHGFQGRYDFVYLPVDFKRWAGLGYAFVNMVTHKDAASVMHHFHLFNDWTVSSSKAMECAWGYPLQGLEEHIERYKNSPVMHEQVDERWKPLIFKDGIRQTFPQNTRRLRPPRNKCRAPLPQGGAAFAPGNESVAENGAEDRFTAPRAVAG